MNFGALLGGAAQGAQMGQQMKTNKQYADAYTQNSANAAEKHDWEKQARDMADSGKKGIIDVANAPLMETPSMQQGMAPVANQAQSTNMAGFQQPMPIASSPGVQRGPTLAASTPFKGRPYASGGLVQKIPDEVFAGQPQAAYQAGGLSSPQPQPQPAPQAAQQVAQQPGDENMSLNDQMSKAIMNTDVLNNPDKLNKIMAIADAHGISGTIKPWLERYYAAKKSGLIDGAQHLMNNRVDDAMDSFSQAGMKLEDRPVKVKPDDPKDHQWTFNISGTGEKTMDVGDMYSRTVDFDKYQKHELAKREQTDKERGTTAEIAERNSRIAYNDGARTDAAKASAEARRASRAGGLARDDGKVDAAVLKRRDDTLSAMSTDEDEDGKKTFDRARRAELGGIASDSEDMLERHFGRQLTTREGHRLTDKLSSAPPASDPAFRDWNLDLKRSFGVPLHQAQAAQGEPEAPARQIEAPDTNQGKAATPAPSAPAPASGGLQQSAESISAPYQGTKYHDEMIAVQKALQTRGLTPTQRAQLALQAQDISRRHAKQYGARANG